MTELRGLLWRSLTETAAIQALTSTSDSGGGATQVWAANGTAACRIDPLGTQRQGRLTGGAIDERSTHVVTLPPATTVATANRLAITGRGTFEVTAVRDRTGERSRVVEVVAT